MTSSRFALLSLAALVVVVAGCGRSTLRGDPGSTLDAGPRPDAPLRDGEVRPDVPSARCGDGACSFPETCSSCPMDCGSCGGCGDGTCGAGESCSTCVPDCGTCDACGDGACSATESDRKSVV